LIAHLGDFLMKNPWIGLGMALLLATGVAVFLVLWFKLGNAVTS